MPTAPLTHKQRTQRPKDSRPNAAKRGYNYRWQKASKAHLRANPLCVECLRDGITKAAECVDHTIPHKGDYKLFWDRSNWQSLCIPCNSRKGDKQSKAKQRIATND